MQTFDIELTDTFAGEANYSWVKRAQIKAKNFRGAIIKAKREFGITLRHVKEDTRETVQLWFPRDNMVLFIEYSQEY